MDSSLISMDALVDLSHYLQSKGDNLNSFLSVSFCSFRYYSDLFTQMFIICKGLGCNEFWCLLQNRSWFSGNVGYYLGIVKVEQTDNEEIKPVYRQPAMLEDTKWIYFGNSMLVGFFFLLLGKVHWSSFEIIPNYKNM